ncbi:hypothetical protein EDB85DRAFT_2157457 [Lactarius pseudohatsudake]|nr:hypothetical protein EDB85DRAFT_2157457 [Lactarius pseudohatsudake]
MERQSLRLVVHDPTFDLRTLLDDACLPHLRRLALDTLAHEAPSNTCACHAARPHADAAARRIDAPRPGHTVPHRPTDAAHAADALESVCVDADALEAVRSLEIASFESIAVFVRTMRTPALAAHARCRLRTPALACHARAPGAPPIPIRASFAVYRSSAISSMIDENDERGAIKFLG